MEAPVPASSLIHSATLVSAGIYLILKFQSLFIYTNLLHIIFFIGSVTACYGGVVASSQSDMKKLLAYSTISHCGFIFASISLNNILVTVVYLYLHGLFKALTFFTAGSIIKYNGSQDMRLMGMQKNQIFNCISLIIASTNLGGLPFTFGYLYKLLFLNYIIIQPISIFSYGFLIVGMVCSVIYVFKIVYYSCFDIRKGYLQVITLLLQNNMISLKEHIFSSSFFKMIAFSIVYIFSILFYFIIKMYILKNYIYFYSLSETQVNDYMFLNELIFAKSYLIKIYYILFITTIVTLLL
jgi:NADH:ubiquinone oxidoreductase subunit 5 (subunit L)/multisubunit Na+/H+ antiporter MnhA subunit